MKANKPKPKTVSMAGAIRRVSYGLAVAATAVSALPAHAQLEEILVTAQKRQESLQDVPVAVSAVTGNYIENQKITDLSALNNTLPNVQINTFSNSPDSAVFNIRGVGVNDADPYVGTTVSVVVDGVVVGVNTAALLSLFDIERIEVLRGPQGTLFGANTTGGVINVITKQPTGEFGGEAQVSAGNHGRINANFALDLPITDDLAGKISVLHTQHDGFFKDEISGKDRGSSNVTSVRGYLQYMNGNYDATLKAEYVRSRNGSQPGVNIAVPGIVLYEEGYSSQKPRFRRTLSPGLKDQNDRDTYALTLTQNFSTDLGDWVSITDYREYDHELYSDDDGLPMTGIHTIRETDHRQYSQELRTTMQLSDSVELLVGAYGFYQEYELRQEGVLDGFMPGLSQPQTQEQERWSASLFSQVYWDINDRLRLQAGLRFAHEEAKAISTTAQYQAQNRPAKFGDRPTMADVIVLQPLTVARGKEDWSDVGYKLGLDYQLYENTMVYGYIARGFKSGGFVGRIASPDDIGPFDTEYLDTIEFGVKADLLDRRLRVNAALFYNKYDDMQVTQNFTYADGSNSATIVNAGEAYSRGFELELTALPTDNLELSLAVAYLDAEYDEYDTLSPDLNDPLGAPIPTDLSGNPLMNAPEWSGNASVNYSLPIAGGESNFFLQVTHAGSKYSNYTALPQEKIESVTLLNGSVSWEPFDGAWKVGVYGRNLTNKKYFSQKIWTHPSFGIAAMGAPREVGVDLNYRW